MPIRSISWAPITRGFACLTLILAALATPFNRVPAALAAPQNFVLLVNNASDADLETCAGSPSGNDCTLRGAIKKINTGSLALASITFAPVVTQTALLNPLPAIVVTGTTILGNSGVPRLDAFFMSNGSVFSVSAPAVQIAGLSIVNGHPFTDGVFADIWVAGGSGVLINDNYLGTLPPGPAVTDCNPNPGGGSLVSRNSGYGVFVDHAVTGSSGASNGSVYIYGNTIGCHSGHGLVLNGAEYVHIGETSSGSPAGNFIGVNSLNTWLMNGEGGVGDGIALVASGSSGARFNTIRANTIANNGRFGILLSGTGTNNSSSTYANLIAGNRIGLTAFGPFPNGRDGVRLAGGAFFNVIGGSTPADRNVISGNLDSGLGLVDSQSNVILGNYIGTGLTGNQITLAAGRPATGGPQAPNINSAGNHLYGIRLDNSANNQIGGPNPADGNVISGNFQTGVLLESSNSNVVNSNRIGLNAAGTTALPNRQDGVWIDNGSTGNDIGSDTVGQAQYISGNVGSGILIQASDGNTVRLSNRIGTDVNGNPAGNGDTGVIIIDSANNDVQPSLVAYNAGAGLAAIGNSSTGNFLVAFTNFGNSGLPVDLGLDGPTPNDGVPDIGPNNFLDYPVITASAGTVITGTVCGGCTVYIFRAQGNPAAAGGGAQLGQFVVADGLGHWSATLAGGLTRTTLTLQTYDGANTSELSPRPILFLPLTRR